MPWSYDPTRAPTERWQWWEHPDRPPEPVRVVWPGEARHEQRIDEPAGEAIRVGAQLLDGIRAIVTDALDALADLDRHDQERGRRRW